MLTEVVASATSRSCRFSKWGARLPLLRSSTMSSGVTTSGASMSVVHSVVPEGITTGDSGTSRRARFRDGRRRRTGEEDDMMESAAGGTTVVHCFLQFADVSIDMVIHNRASPFQRGLKGTASPL